MKTDRRTFLQASLGVAAAGPYPPPAGANESDQCAIVIGPGANHLEMKAGWELQRYLEQLFGFTPVMEEDALGSAAQADKHLAAGTSRGPLHGIPIAIKKTSVR